MDISEHFEPIELPRNLAGMTGELLATIFEQVCLWTSYNIRIVGHLISLAGVTVYIPDQKRRILCITSTIGSLCGRHIALASGELVIDTTLSPAQLINFSKTLERLGQSYHLHDDQGDRLAYHIRIAPPRLIPKIPVEVCFRKETDVITIPIPIPPSILYDRFDQPDELRYDTMCGCQSGAVIFHSRSRDLMAMRKLLIFRVRGYLNAEALDARDMKRALATERRAMNN